MTNFIVIFVCFLAGVLCRRVKRFPSGSGRAFNAFVIYLSLPAMILIQFPKLLASADLDAGLIWLALMPWTVFGLSWILFSFLGSRFGWSRTMTAGMVLTAGLGNTSFVGFPLLEALVGADSIRYGVVVDQFGSFLVLSLAGIPFAAARSGGRVTAPLIANRILTFPPFIAVVAAGLWYATGLPLQARMLPALEKIAGTLVPLALFAVGFQLEASWSALRRRSVPLTVGLVYKLILAPLIFFGLVRAMPGVASDLAQVIVLQAGMAPMITAAIVAGEFDLEPALANLMVAVGIPVSLITVPLLHLLF